MKPGLKLNNITNLHDARYCSAVGIQLLGFNLGRNAGEILDPEEVATIMEWLSGPESVGEFATADLDLIRSYVERCRLDHVSLPLDQATQDLQALESQLIFRVPLGMGLKDAQNQLQQFPEARIEIDLPNDEAEWKAWQASGWLPRMILRAEAPDTVYHLLRKNGTAPFTFSLGEFVEEPDGAIDYEQCDAFIEAYETLLPA